MTRQRVVLSGILSTLTVLLAVGRVSADEADDRVWEALKREKGLELRDETLDELAALLADRLKVDVSVDRNALEEARIPVDTQIRANLAGVSCKTALALVLNKHDLSYFVDRGALIITTGMMCGEKTIVRIYTVPKELRVDPRAVQASNIPPGCRRDLGTATRVEEASSTLSRIVRVLKQTVTPDTTWDVFGGPSEIRVLGNQLVVSAPQPVQEDVAELLKNLARAELEGGVVPIRSDALILERLKKRVDLKFDVSTMEDFVQVCTDVVDVPFFVDEVAFENAAIPLSMTAEANWENLEFGTALDAVLQKRRLAWVATDELVVITTRRSAERIRTTASYPIGDLTMGSAFGAAQLLRLVENTVAVDSWESQGGYGSILAAPSNRTLVISTSNFVHQRIAKLLADLRADWDPKVFDEQRNRIIDIAYAVTNEKVSLEDVLTFLQSEKNGIEWNEQVYGQVVGDRLIIRHRADDHFRIQKLIQWLGNQTEPAVGRRRGRGGFGGFDKDANFSEPTRTKDED